MAFFTQFNRQSAIFSNSGSDIIKEPIRDENGYIVDYEISDLDAMIQSNADSGNVALLLERYALTGDDSVLHSNSGFYGDVTDVQNSTLHDRVTKTKIAEDFYNSLPDKIRDLYPTAEDFYANIEDDKIANMFDNVTPDPVISNTVTSESEVDDE